MRPTNGATGTIFRTKCAAYPGGSRASVLKMAPALLSVSLVTIALTLGACASGSSRHTNAAEHSGPAGTDPGYPLAGADDEIVLYRWSTRHLVRYSTRKKAVTFETRSPQTFQYAFSARSGLYTSGDSIAYGFRLLEIDGGQARTVLRADGPKGLFPVARTTTDTVVSVVDYDALGHIRGSRLARVRGGRLDTITELTASPLGGAILGDRLYFTTAAADGRQTYDLLVTDLNMPRPTRVRTGLRSPQIYAGNGRLIVDGRSESIGSTGATGSTGGGAGASDADGGGGTGGAGGGGGAGREGESFPCQYDCSTEDSGRWLFSLRPDRYRDLVFEVFSLSSGRSVWSTVGDVVDYRMDNGKLTVYLNGEIRTHNLGVEK